MRFETIAAPINCNRTIVGKTGKFIENAPDGNSYALKQIWNKFLRKEPEALLDLWLKVLREAYLNLKYMFHPIAGRYPIAVTLPIPVTFSMIHMKMIVSELFSL